MIHFFRHLRRESQYFYRATHIAMMVPIDITGWIRRDTLFKHDTGVGYEMIFIFIREESQRRRCFRLSRYWFYLIHCHGFTKKLHEKRA